MTPLKTRAQNASLTTRSNGTSLKAIQNLNLGVVIAQKRGTESKPVVPDLVCYGRIRHVIGKASMRVRIDEHDVER